MKALMPCAVLAAVLQLCAADWMVGTFAGTGDRGLRDGAASQALFDAPSDVVVDPRSGVTYIADTGNGRIRAVDASGAVSTLLAGGSGFSGPNGLALDVSNNLLFFTDTKNHAVWVVPLVGPPTPSLVIGTLQQPARLAVHSTGHLAVTTISSHAVYLILLGCKTPGQVCNCLYDARTKPCVFVIGEEHDCDHVDGGMDRVRFCNPSGLAFSSDGALFIADTQNDAIRVVVLPPGSTTSSSSSPHPADLLAGLSAARVATLAVGRKPSSAHGLGPGGKHEGHEDDDDDDGASPEDHGESPHRRALSSPRARFERLDNVIHGDAEDQQVASHGQPSSPSETELRSATAPSRLRRGPASDVTLRKPVDIAVSPDSTRLFVADTERHRVVLFSSASATIAGGAGPGYTDGNALQARFDLPSGIAAVSGTLVLVADPHRNVIRSLVEVQASAAPAGSDDRPQTRRSLLLPLLMVVSLSTLLLFGVARVLRRKSSLLPHNALTNAIRHHCARLVRAVPCLQRLTRHREAYAMAPPYQRVPRSYLETSF